MRRHMGFAVAVSALALSMLACQVVEFIPGVQPTTIHGSGNLETQEESFTGFNKVDASHSFEVEISQSEEFSVVIRADDNVMEYVEVTKVGSTLKIGLEPGRDYNLRNVTLEATVTMPVLTGLTLSGASHGDITGFESTEPLDLDLSGASSVRGDIEAGDANFEFSGASTADLTGSAQNLTVDASGASDANLAEFAVTNANVDASGASEVTVNVSGTLDVDASGASHVYYLGDPTLGKIDTSGASTVREK